MKKSQIYANILTGLVLLSLLAFQIIYYFMPKTKKNLQFQVNSDIMFIDGMPKKLTSAPVLIAGSTMIPMRAFGEAFGAEVGYDTATRTVTIKWENNVLELVIDKTQALLNGTPVMLLSAPKLIDGTTIVHIRVAEFFSGTTIDYNASTRMIAIIRDQAAEYARGINVSMVAFTVTFIVLIMVTLAIHATKILLERQVREKIAPVVDKASKAIKVALKGVPELEEGEMTAIITAAIRQFEADTSIKPVGLDFVVKPFASSSSVWKTQNLEDYGKTW